MPAATLLSDFTLEDIQELIELNPSLRGYLQGYLSEHRLKKYLLGVPGIESVEKIPDASSEKGDFRILYKNTPITIEAKSVSSRRISHDILVDTWKGQVILKAPSSRDIDYEGVTYRTSVLPRGTFDILAVCSFNVTKTWDYFFIKNKHLPVSTKYSWALDPTFSVSPGVTPNLHSELVPILENIAEAKLHTGLC